MNTNSYILDTPLPLNQDFTSLKDEALAYIQEFSGYEWTNLNASDPGITILDQLCFALTELGYCNDFPLVDILTDQAGNINFEDQFYLPEDILTTSPVTIDDYRKYLIDGVESVQNVIIYPVVNGTGGSYRVYLMIDNIIADEAGRSDVCTAAFYYLNKRRNLGETFAMVRAFEPLVHLISGRIEIASEKELNRILVGINDTIRDHIFPRVFPMGYAQLIERGTCVNDVFNGPLLRRGWIPTNELGVKVDSLSLLTLIQLIESVHGVKSAAILDFDNGIASAIDQLLAIDLEGSLNKGLEIYYHGKKLSPDLKALANLFSSQEAEANIEDGALVTVQTEVPVGQFRDINTYYSIQNTFPEIFAVGSNAVTSNAASFQVAQSRQLKGYLTLFDQVLANQFSQLANIGSLFSFKNPISANPSDRHEFYAAQNTLDMWKSEYPVPYQAFSPTYFFQSLYDVPHIKNLLKDYGTFKYAIEPGNVREPGTSSWTAYKLDPYNPYIRGLMGFIEDEGEALTRRNNILDHLLARHGESPLIINAMIEGSAYTGDSIKDTVIFKSLYLQNLGKLSYYRQKAYNFLTAGKILGAMEEIPLNLVQNALKGDSKDFLFNSDNINHVEKLRDQDFIDYSTIELKLSLLFGLKACYENFIANYYTGPNSQEALVPASVKAAFWLIRQRRGFILLETALLWPYVDFELMITSVTDASLTKQTTCALDYQEAQALDNLLGSGVSGNLAGQIQNKCIAIGPLQYILQDVNQGDQSCKKYQPVKGTDYAYTIKIKSGIEIGAIRGNALFGNRVELIFPSFIPQFDTIEFNNRLDFFLQDTMPLQVSCKYHITAINTLVELIPAFAAWHNALLYTNGGADRVAVNQQLRQNAGTLAGLIININSD